MSPKISSSFKNFIQLLLVVILAGWYGPVFANSACVVAKQKGHSEAIELVYAGSSAAAANDLAEQRLRQQGYKHVFTQVITELPHAYVIIVKSEYKNWRNRERTSYGCGYSAVSYTEALQNALHNLNNYAWGWDLKRDGYNVFKKFKY